MGSLCCYDAIGWFKAPAEVSRFWKTTGGWKVLLFRQVRGFTGHSQDFVAATWYNTRCFITCCFL